MRQALLEAPANYPVTCHHCVSRVVDRRFLLWDEEREMFVKLLRR
jgi:hypothetical protein